MRYEESIIYRLGYIPVMASAAKLLSDHTKVILHVGTDIILTPPSQLDQAKQERCSDGEGAAAGVVKGSHNSNLSEGWTGKQMNEWKMHTGNAWLKVERGMLGCFECRAAKSLLPAKKKPDVHIVED